VLSAFLAAARQGDLAGLMRLLAPDVVFTSDGGGVVSAARRPVVGADKVARFLVGLGEKAGAEILADTVLVNGAAGAVLGLLPPGAKVVIAGVISLDVSFDGLITAIDFVANPWKLTRVPVPVAEPGTPAPT
jgi:RNA polymerase sigma-70 factor (ECF subfamily)